MCIMQELELTQQALQEQQHSAAIMLAAPT
jgi:hypothetical protein